MQVLVVFIILLLACSVAYSVDEDVDIPIFIDEDMGDILRDDASGSDPAIYPSDTLYWAHITGSGLQIGEQQLPPMSRRVFFVHHWQNFAGERSNRETFRGAMHVFISRMAVYLYDGFTYSTCQYMPVPEGQAGGAQPAAAAAAAVAAIAAAAAAAARAATVGFVDCADVVDHDEQDGDVESEQEGQFQI